MSWLKFHRDRMDGLELLLRHPFALALLTMLAARARYSAGRDPGSGVELQVGEALTGRGDSVKIGASPKQYRVARDQLIKWGFVAMVRATSRAMWGTVLKITDTAIYEIVPLVEGQAEGQAEGQVEGQGGAKEGPRRGHESKKIDQIDHHHPPPPPGEQEVVAGAGQIKEYVRLAEINGQAKNPAGLERHLLKNGLSESHIAQLAAWRREDGEDDFPSKTKDYRAILAGRDPGERLAAQYAWPGESWLDFKARIKGELTRLGAN